MDYQNADRIFIIGFPGSDRTGLAEKISRELGYQYVDLDKEIEKADGRNISRICMMMGEHEYRNKEYEQLYRLCAEEKVVVACGDGVVLDDESRNLLKKNTVLLADWDRTLDELWQQFCNTDTIRYAFMQGSEESEKKAHYDALYESRKQLYNEFIETANEK